jgi:hypothetical protein
MQYDPHRYRARGIKSVRYTHKDLPPSFYLVIPQPFLSIVSLLLIKCHIDQCTFIILYRTECFQMTIHICKVSFGILCCTCTQTLIHTVNHDTQRHSNSLYLVVFNPPTFTIIGFFFPCFIFRDCEKGNSLITFGSLST